MNGDGSNCADILGLGEQTPQGLAVDTLVTAVLARVERRPDIPTGPRRLRWSNAGHLPPLLLAPDGTSRLLEGDHGVDLMLGVDLDVPRTDSVVDLLDDHTLLLFTDGLVERHGSSLDEGSSRCRRRSPTWDVRSWASCATPSLARLARDSEDDVALFAVRGYPEDRPRPAEAGPDDQPDA